MATRNLGSLSVALVADLRTFISGIDTGIRKIKQLRDEAESLKRVQRELARLKFPDLRTSPGQVTIVRERGGPAGKIQLDLPGIQRAVAEGVKQAMAGLRLPVATGEAVTTGPTRRPSGGTHAARQAENALLAGGLPREITFFLAAVDRMAQGVAELTVSLERGAGLFGGGRAGGAPTGGDPRQQLAGIIGKQLGGIAGPTLEVTADIAKALRRLNKEELKEFITTFVTGARRADEAWTEATAHMERRVSDAMRQARGEIDRIVAGTSKERPVARRLESEIEKDVRERLGAQLKQTVTPALFQRLSKIAAQELPEEKLLAQLRGAIVEKFGKLANFALPREQLQSLLQQLRPSSRLDPSLERLVRAQLETVFDPEQIKALTSRQIRQVTSVAQRLLRQEEESNARAFEETRAERIRNSRAARQQFERQLAELQTQESREVLRLQALQVARQQADTAKASAVEKGQLTRQLRQQEAALGVIRNRAAEVSRELQQARAAESGALGTEAPRGRAPLTAERLAEALRILLSIKSETAQATAAQVELGQAGAAAGNQVAEGAARAAAQLDNEGKEAEAAAAQLKKLGGEVELLFSRAVPKLTRPKQLFQTALTELNKQIKGLAGDDLRVFETSFKRRFIGKDKALPTTQDLEVIANNLRLLNRLRAAEAQEREELERGIVTQREFIETLKKRAAQQARVAAGSGGGGGPRPPRPPTPPSGGGPGSRDPLDQLPFIDRFIGGVGRAILIQARWFLGFQLLFGAINRVREALSGFTEFDDEIARLGAITGEVGAQMRSLAKDALGIGKTTPISATEAARALTALAQAGFTGEEAVSALRGVTLLAVGGVASLDQATKLLTTTIVGFNLEASHSERIANALVASVNKSKLTVESLNTAFGFSAQTAAAAGLKLEDLLALLGTLADAGLSASTQGTAVRQAIAALINPTERAQKVFDRLGLTLAELDPLQNDIVVILERLRDAGFGASEAFQAFEKRTASGILALVRHAESARELREQITGTDAAEVAFARAQESVTAQLTIALNKFTALAAVIGEDFKPAVVGAIGVLQTLLDLLIEFRPVVEAVGIALALMVAKLALMSAAAKVGLLSTLSTAFANLGGTIGNIAFSLTDFPALLASIRAGFLALATSTGGVLLAIGALVALFFELRRSSQEFVDRLDLIQDRANKAAGEGRFLAREYEEAAKALERATPKSQAYAVALTDITVSTARLISRFPELLDLLDKSGSKFREGVNAAVLNQRIAEAAAARGQQELRDELKKAGEFSVGGLVRDLISPDTRLEQIATISERMRNFGVEVRETSGRLADLRNKLADIEHLVREGKLPDALKVQNEAITKGAEQLADILEVSADQREEFTGRIISLLRDEQLDTEKLRQVTEQYGGTAKKVARDDVHFILNALQELGIVVERVAAKTGEASAQMAARFETASQKARAAAREFKTAEKELNEFLRLTEAGVPEGEAGRLAKLRSLLDERNRLVSDRNKKALGEIRKVLTPEEFDVFEKNKGGLSPAARARARDAQKTVNEEAKELILRNEKEIQQITLGNVHATATERRKAERDEARERAKSRAEQAAAEGREFEAGRLRAQVQHTENLDNIADEFDARINAIRQEGQRLGDNNLLRQASDLEAARAAKVRAEDERFAGEQAKLRLQEGQAVTRENINLLRQQADTEAEVLEAQGRFVDAERVRFDIRKQELALEDPLLRGLKAQTLETEHRKNLIEATVKEIDFQLQKTREMLELEERRAQAVSGTKREELDLRREEFEAGNTGQGRAIFEEEQRRLELSLELEDSNANIARLRKSITEQTESLAAAEARLAAASESGADNLTVEEQQAQSLQRKQAETTRKNITGQEIELFVAKKHNDVILRRIQLIKKAGEQIFDVGRILEQTIQEAFQGIVLGTSELGDVFKNAGNSLLSELTGALSKTIVEKSGFDQLFKANFLDLGKSAGQAILSPLLNAFGVAGKGLDSLTTQAEEAAHLASLGQQVPSGVDLAGPSSTFAQTEQATGQLGVAGTGPSLIGQVLAAVGAAIAVAKAAKQIADSVGAFKKQTLGDKKATANLGAFQALNLATFVGGGAAGGAAIGSIFPGIGTVVGAALGAALGALIASILNKNLVDLITKNINASLSPKQRAQIEGGAPGQRQFEDKIFSDQTVKILRGFGNPAGAVFGTRIGSGTSLALGAAVNPIGSLIEHFFAQSIPDIEILLDKTFARFFQNIGVTLNRHLGGGVQQLTRKSRDLLRSYGDGIRNDARSVVQLIGGVIGGGTQNQERLIRFYNALLGSLAQQGKQATEVQEVLFRAVREIGGGSFIGTLRIIENLFRPNQARQVGDFRRQVDLLNRSFKELLGFRAIDLPRFTESLVQGGDARAGQRAESRSRRTVKEATGELFGADTFETGLEAFTTRLSDGLEKALTKSITKALLGGLGGILGELFGIIGRFTAKAQRQGGFTPEAIDKVNKKLEEAEVRLAQRLVLLKPFLKEYFDFLKQLEDQLEATVDPGGVENRRRELVLQLSNAIEDLVAKISALIREQAQSAARLTQKIFENTGGEGIAPSVVPTLRGGVQEQIQQFAGATGLSANARLGILGDIEGAIDEFLSTSLEAIEGKFREAIDRAEAAKNELESVQAELLALRTSRTAGRSAGESLGLIAKQIADQQKLLVAGDPEEQLKAAQEIRRLAQLQLQVGAETLDQSGPQFRALERTTENQLQQVADVLKADADRLEELTAQMEAEIAGARAEAAFYYAYVQQQQAIAFKERFEATQTQLEQVLAALGANGDIATALANLKTASIDKLEDIADLLNRILAVEAGGPDPGPSQQEDVPPAPPPGSPQAIAAAGVQPVDPKSGAIKRARREVGADAQIARDDVLDKMLNAVSQVLLAIPDARKPDKIQAFVFINRLVREAITQALAALPAMLGFQQIGEVAVFVRNLLDSIGLPGIDKHVDNVIDRFYRGLSELHGGGFVTKDGMFQLQKGEAVLPLTATALRPLAEALLDSIARSENAIRGLALAARDQASGGRTGTPVTTAGTDATEVTAQLTVNIQSGAIQITASNTPEAIEEIGRLPDKLTKKIAHSIRFGELGAAVQQKVGR